MDFSAQVTGIGAAVGSRVVTNAELALRYDTTDEWIRTRTGITERRWITETESTSDLAVEAARAALASRGETTCTPIDAVVVATATPDRRCPATAPVVAAALGLRGVPAFDVSAVCSGFLYALATASGLLATHVASAALVIGADTFSTIIDPDDRTTAAVFGDGAGAVIVENGTLGADGAVLAHTLGSDGDLESLIIAKHGGSRRDSGDAYLRMAGQATYRHAVDRMTQSTHAVLERTGWSTDDIDLFVAHQANARILQTVGSQLALEPARVFCDIDVFGNTAAASIPLALADACHQGRLNSGDRLVLSAFGGGATWGATTLTWPEIPAIQPISGRDKHATASGA